MIDNWFDVYFRQYGTQYGGPHIDWLWFKSQAMAESGLNPEAKSSAGAIGVMQLMPSTAEEIAARLGIACLPLVPHLNIQMGIAYCKRCWDVWQAEDEIERLRFTFASYNAGTGNIVKAQKLAGQSQLPTDRWEYVARMLQMVTGRHAAETIHYVERIERIYKHLTGRES